MLENEDLELLKQIGWDEEKEPVEFLKRLGIFEFARLFDRFNFPKESFVRGLRALLRSGYKPNKSEAYWILNLKEEVLEQFFQVAIEEGMDLRPMALEAVGVSHFFLNKLHSIGFRFKGKKAAQSLYRALNSPNFLEMVLKMGADPNEKVEGLYPLEHLVAKNFGSLKVLRYLLIAILVAYGADLSVIRWKEKDRQELWEAMRRINFGNYLSEEKLFEMVQKLSLLEYRDDQLESVLYIAAQRGWASFIRQAVGYFDFNEKTSYGSTALHIVSEWGLNAKKEVAEALIEGGADPNALDGKGKSPLTLAIERGDLDLAARIFTLGGKIIGQINVNTLSKRMKEAKRFYPELAKEIRRVLDFALLKEL